DNSLLTKALLAQTEVAMQNGDAQSALSLVTQTFQRFTSGSQLESQWRANLMAAQASAKLGDNAKRDEYLAQARNALGQLQQTWGDENFKRYLARPDVRYYQKEFGLESN